MWHRSSWRFAAILPLIIACGEPTKRVSADNGVADAVGGTAASPAAVAPAPRSADVPEIVAEIGGTPVSWSELFDKAAPELVEAEVAMHQARQDALSSYLAERLIEAEAKKQGIEPDALLRAEVATNMQPITEADARAFYEQNRQRMPASYEEVAPRIQQHLEQERSTGVVRAFVAKLRADNGVKVFLPPLRLGAEAEDSARKGSADAVIQIVEWSDFQCPYCTDGAATAKAVLDKYGDKVALTYRHFPLPFHQQAHKAAQASECANDQEQFWSFHDSLFADQKPWTDEDLQGYASAAKLDMKAFKECLDSGKHAATVDDDISDGRRVGMSGTPGFYINGIVLSGARPIEDFVEVIDAELARLNP